MALMPMSLRLEGADGSPGEEYRISDEDIEVRKLHQILEGARRGGAWHRLSAGQLSAHVRRNTVVAEWLQRRLGWRRLLQKCVDLQTPNDAGEAENTVDRHAA
jgi:hypothetical protein